MAANARVRWWNGAAGSCPASTAQLTEWHSRKCCYTATRLENISLLIQTAAAWHSAITSAAAARLWHCKGSRTAAAQAPGAGRPCWTHLNEGQRSWMLVCLQAAKATNTGKTEIDSKGKFSTGVHAFLTSPHLPPPTPLPLPSRLPPLSPPGFLQPILSRSCGCCSNIFKDYYGIR